MFLQAVLRHERHVKELTHCNYFIKTATFNYIVVTLTDLVPINQVQIVLEILDISYIVLKANPLPSILDFQCKFLSLRITRSIFQSLSIPFE